MKKIILALLITFLLSTSAIASENNSHNGIISEQQINDQSVLTKEEIFTAKFGDNWQVSTDKNSELPDRMIGGSIDLPSEDLDKKQTFSLNTIQNKPAVEPAVRNFIVENKQIFGLDSSEIDLIKEDHDKAIYEKMDGINNIAYQQSYEGIPVYSSRLGVTVNDGKIVAVDSNYFPDITAPTEPSINEMQALSAISSDLGIDIATPVLPLDSILLEKTSKAPNNEREAIKAKDISLVIYPLERGDNYEYHLAYKVELNTIMEPLGSWVYFVDAIDGQVLYRYDKITPYTIEGNVIGSIYPESTSQTPINVAFWNQTLYLLNDSNTNKALHSGNGNNMTSYAITTTSIDLTSAVNSTFNFDTRYDIELDWDYAYAAISENGSSFDFIKSYTGKQNTWITESINISKYDGKQVWIGFVYITDQYVNEEGFYADNITVSSENGIVFSDDLEDSKGNWTLHEFSLNNVNILPLATTNKSGYYKITDLSENTTIYSELSGPYVKVINEDQTEPSVKFNLTTPTYNWNWADIDISDRREESNVFNHVNVIHDYFTRGEPFDIHSMDYQTIATVQYGSESGNAFSDHTNIYFFAGNETFESTALLSDVIYHEYTHSVVAHVYTTYLPYINESGALNEGWADYFACTVNNNSILGEGFYVGSTNGLRDLNKTYRYPDDIVGEVHYDSQIISGAMWDMREMLGTELSDELVIRAMKLEPQDFREYLEDILIVDDDNGDLSDGTPHINEIYEAFYVNHGIHTPLFDNHIPEASNEFPSNGSFCNNNTTAIYVDITDVININSSSINMTVNTELVSFTSTEIDNGYKVEYITSTPYEEGNVTICVNASNDAGKLLTHTWSFIVDATKPTSTKPADIEFSANSTADFTYWKLFDLHPAYYWVLHNGTEIVSPHQWTNDTNLTIPVNTNIGLGDFNYTIQYNDTAGNYGDPDTIIININDTSAPYAFEEMPANGSYINDTLPLIYVNIVDNASGVKKSSISMIVNGTDVDFTNISISKGYNVSNVTAMEFAHNQTIDVMVNATDNNSNSMSYGWSFTIDNSTPTIAITSPMDGHSTTSGSVTISGIANGTGSPAAVTVNGIETSFEGINGTFSETVGLSIGTNTIYANVTDSAGNTNTTSINVTRSTLPTTQTSNGGGGGGGGGGNTGEAYENIQKKEVVNQFINKGEISYEFREDVNGIDYINFEALKNSGKINVNIEILKDRSSKVNSDPGGKVYQNMNIWVGKAGFATENNIADPVIGFKVKKTWIDENDIDQSTIKLNRYHDEQWNPLPTTKTGEDEEYVYFEASTPGFSPFSITGDEKQIQVIEQEQTSVVEDEEQSLPLEKTEPTQQKDTPGFTSTMLAGILILLMRCFKGLRHIKI